MGNIGVGDVRAGAFPDMGDDLCDSERENGAEPSRHDTMASVLRGPLAPRQKEDCQESDEEELGVEREEAENVLKPSWLTAKPLICS